MTIRRTPFDDIPDKIDAVIAATADPCVTCGARLPRTSDSPDYCNETCQDVWFGLSERPAEWIEPDAPGHRVATPNPAIAVYQAGFFANLGREIHGLYTRVFGTLSAQITAAFSHIERSAPPQTPERLDLQEPADPMERALWLRRNRNTGPKPRRQLAPRRIDPRGDR